MSEKQDDLQHDSECRIRLSRESEALLAELSSSLGADHRRSRREIIEDALKRYRFALNNPYQHDYSELVSLLRRLTQLNLLIAKGTCMLIAMVSELEQCDLNQNDNLPVT